MRTRPRHVLWLAALVAVPLAAWGCKSKTSPTTATQPPPMPAPGGGAAAGPGPRGGESGTKQIMIKIAKGPTSLNEQIKRELQAEQPDWAAIQPQAAEYARLAADLGKADPPKGTPESWAKQTAAFSESASALDKAAQAKDLAGAKAAEDKLGGSCMQCHQAHRGGRGGPPGGFGPPGGRGAPGGPPPG